MLTGFKRSETRRGRGYTVQPVSASRAVKTYACPGCGGEVPPGVSHVVVWREDGVLGAAADLADRRHWHSRCWEIS